MMILEVIIIFVSQRSDIVARYSYEYYITSCVENNIVSLLETLRSPKIILIYATLLQYIRGLENPYVKMILLPLMNFNTLTRPV